MKSVQRVAERHCYLHIARWMLNRFPVLQYLYDKGFLHRSLPSNDVVLSWDEQQILVRNPRQSLIGREIFLKGIWEQEVTMYISPKVGKGMTVVDVGADIGYYTLLFAKRVGSGGRVIAFEPIPAARGKLEYNIELNSYNNVDVYGFALFSSNGLTVLEEPFRTSRLNPMKTSVEPDELQVKTVIFDEWASEVNLEKLDLVKIDVEGAELDVLYGMQESIRNYHPLMVVEVHPDHLTRFNHCADDLVRFLSSMGYSLIAVDKPSLSFENGNITIACTYPGRLQSV